MKVCDSTAIYRYLVYMGLRWKLEPRCVAAWQCGRRGAVFGLIFTCQITIPFFLQECAATRGNYQHSSCAWKKMGNLVACIMSGST